MLERMKAGAKRHQGCTWPKRAATSPVIQAMTSPALYVCFLFEHMYMYVLNSKFKSVHGLCDAIYSI